MVSTTEEPDQARKGFMELVKGSGWPSPARFSLLVFVLSTVISAVLIFSIAYTFPDNVFSHQTSDTEHMFREIEMRGERMRYDAYEVSEALSQELRSAGVSPGLQEEFRDWAINFEGNLERIVDTAARWRFEQREVKFLGIFSIQSVSTYILVSIVFLIVMYALFARKVVPNVSSPQKFLVKRFGKDQAAILPILIDEIDHRIRNLMRRSTLLLFGIIVVLGGTVYLIIVAGELTRLDVEAASFTDNVRREVEQARDRIRGIEEKIIESEAKYAPPSMPKPVSASQQEPVDASEELTGQAEVQKADLSVPPPREKKSEKDAPGPGINLNDSVAYKAELESLRRQAEDARLDLQEAHDRYDKAFDKQITSGDAQQFSNQNFIIATGVIRVAIVAVAIFLVQIFVGLYRYNLRLATFYRTRRDFLFRSLKGKIDLSDEEWIDFLTPDGIDFGKTPTSPVATLAGLLRRQ